MGVEGALPSHRPLEIGSIAGRLMQHQRGADHGGEVGRQAGKQQFARAPGVPEAVALGHAARDEVEGADGHGDPARLVQDDPGIDQA